MDAILSIMSADLNEEAIQNLTWDFKRAIERQTEIETKIPEGISRDRARGEPFTLGVIILTLLTSRTIKSLFDLVKVYLERDSSLEMEFQFNNGEKIKINSKNLNSNQFDNAIASINKILRAKND